MQPKKYMLQAIKKLLKNRSIDSISVQDILREANVSRATFYKYFWDKYDLANAYYSEYVKENIMPQYDGSNWYDLLVVTLTFLQENRDYFRPLIDLSEHSLADFLSEFGEKGYRQNFLNNTGKKDLDTEDKYVLEFYNAGCVRVISSWLKGGCSDSPKYVADLVRRLLPSVYHEVDIASSAFFVNSYQSSGRE